MRAHEFVIESRSGKITKRQQYGTVGLNIYRNGEQGGSGNYTMNRIGLAAAATDGTFVPEIDPQSWVGNYKTAHPYTKEEQDKLKMAYKAVGARYEDLNSGDLESQEPPGGNVKSPVVSFKGYPR
jgi:hypothetical protein